MKNYFVLYNVGRCRYLVNYHDGVSMHRDGSLFYDVALFSNKVKMNQFIKRLKTEGYTQRY